MVGRQLGRVAGLVVLGQHVDHHGRAAEDRTQPTWLVRMLRQRVDADAVTVDRVGPGGVTRRRCRRSRRSRRRWRSGQRGAGAVAAANTRMIVGRWSRCARSTHPAARSPAPARRPRSGRRRDRPAPWHRRAPAARTRRRSSTVSSSPALGFGLWPITIAWLRVHHVELPFGDRSVGTQSPSSK